jgi:hypothetical protein
VDRSPALSGWIGNLNRWVRQQLRQAGPADDLTAWDHAVEVAVPGETSKNAAFAEEAAIE